VRHSPVDQDVDPSGAPSKWTLFASKTSSWTVDSNTSFSGNRSIRLDISESSGLSALLLSAPLSVEEHRTYQLSACVPTCLCLPTCLDGLSCTPWVVVTLNHSWPWFYSRSSPDVFFLLHSSFTSLTHYIHSLHPLALFNLFNHSLSSLFSFTLCSSLPPLTPFTSFTPMPRYVRVDSIAGDSPWLWLVQVDANNKEISGGDHLPTGAQMTGPASDEWKQITCTFVAEPTAASFYVYAGLTGNTTANTRVWVDDVMVVSLDYALANTIRTTVTDVVIRPPGVPRSSTDKLFHAGTDYTVVDNRGVPPKLPSDFRAGKVKQILF
jgi:hypothetical protein